MGPAPVFDCPDTLSYYLFPPSDGGNGWLVKSPFPLGISFFFSYYLESGQLIGW